LIFGHFEATVYPPTLKMEAAFSFDMMVTSARPNAITRLKTVIFTVFIMRTSNLTEILISSFSEIISSMEGMSVL
jgi:hypothetical protein